VHGLWLSQLSKNKELMGAAWERLSKWIEEGRLHPVVGREFPVERAVEAYRLLAEGKNYGKIVLKM
jgi:NADPH:quinone reductase-like Zn-dependent oxidoreductase